MISFLGRWKARSLAAPAIACAVALPTASSSASASDNTLGAAIYGQLNFGALQVDNGSGRERYLAENPSVPSRVGILWDVPLAGHTSLTLNLETGLGLTNLSEVSPTKRSLGFDFQRSDLRKFEVIFASETWGRLSLGQGSMASDGAAGVDLSRTSLALGPAIADLGGRTEFLSPEGTASGLFVEDVFDDLAGVRKLRLRYDTPAWNGLTVSVAHGTDVLRPGENLNFTDVAATYAMQTDHIVLEAAASYEWVDRRQERAVASASILHIESGLNAALATGANQRGHGGYVYAKLGLIRDLTRLGKTAIALEYYHGEDLGFRGSRSEAVGFGLIQNIAVWNLDLVAAVRRYDLSASAVALEEIDVVLIGARWQF